MPQTAHAAEGVFALQRTEAGHWRAAWMQWLAWAHLHIMHQDTAHASNAGQQ